MRANASVDGQDALNAVVPQDAGSLTPKELECQVEQLPNPGSRLNLQAVMSTATTPNSLRAMLRLCFCSIVTNFLPPCGIAAQRRATAALSVCCGQRCATGGAAPLGCRRYGCNDCRHNCIRNSYP
eukprot:437709-Pleurochrysis_carterae.AAC.2